MRDACLNIFGHEFCTLNVYLCAIHVVRFCVCVPPSFITHVGCTHRAMRKGLAEFFLFIDARRQWQQQPKTEQKKSSLTHRDSSMCEKKIKTRHKMHTQNICALRLDQNSSQPVIAPQPRFVRQKTSHENNTELTKFFGATQ